jgi:GDP-L-fucose synthase
MEKIFIAGHKGMVGSALVRKAKSLGIPDTQIIIAPKQALDLRNQSDTFEFIRNTSPDVVIVAAAKVGGILYNSTKPAEFAYDNLTIATNVIHGSYEAGVKRLLFLGSSCIYPKFASQPIQEDCLLSGSLEPTNEAYAIAKIAALKLCEYYSQQYGVVYHSAMPTNLYGIGDTYHKDNSHVIPALILKFHEAKINNLDKVTLWGSGTPMREFLYTDDLADACFHLLSLENPPNWVNVGYGEDISIFDLAKKISKVVGYNGLIETDISKPDGTPKKLLDNSLINFLGWKPKTSLEEGLKLAYKDYLSK